MDRLQELEDRFAIHELLARYARGIDTRDWPVYRAVFTDDATIDYTSAGAMAGTVDEVAAALEQGFASIPYSQHYITNVEIQLDRDRAHVRAMFFNPMRLPGMDEQSACGGFYHHDVVRTADGWKSERLVEENLWFENRPGGAPAPS